VLLLDSEGKERARREGYLPNKDFVAALMSGLGRIAFVQKKYSDAERLRIESVNRVFALTLTIETECWPKSHFRTSCDSPTKRGAPLAGNKLWHFSMKRDAPSRCGST
jgi:hypothetical protein